MVWTILNFIFITHWRWPVGLFILYLAYGASTAMLEAFLDVRSRKKVPMYWCSQCQSFFKEEYALSLFPEMKSANVKVCPMCYKKKVFDDPNKRLYN